jgi:transposase
MQSISTIGLDIAKTVFQVHGVDAASQLVARRLLRRRHVLAFFQKLPPCLVGIEACASSHYWSRELQALGHTVRLMPPAYVKPYVKRQKNDATDAEAILRGGQETQHAVRTDQDGRATELSDASSRAISSSASRRPSSTQSAPIWRSSGLSRLSGAGGSSDCWKSSPIQPTIGSPR